MSWDYRVIKVKRIEGDESNWQLFVHEVYYDKEGERNGRSADPVVIGGYADDEDMRGDVELIVRAFDKPFIEMYWEEYMDN